MELLTAILAPKVMIETLPSYELYNCLYNSDPPLDDTSLGSDFSMEIDTCLKQIYRPGEVISGTITMMNRTGHDIETDGLMVSFIGVQTITNIKNPISPIMIDSSIIDMHELSLLDKVIPRGVTKKEFAFMVPYYLLDSNCPHQIVDHLQIPSTFGKPNDYTTPGQRIRYGVKAQLLPWKDFQFVEIGISTRGISFQNMLHSSTADQIRLVTEYVDEEINVLNERLNLHKLGISSFNNQNEIIYASKQYKKDENSYNGFKIVDLQDQISKESPNMSLSCFEVNKSMFSQGSKILISVLAKSVTIGSKIPVDIIFYSKEPPFKSFTFTPVLFVVNYQSQSPIPVRFDSDFVLTSGFSLTRLKLLRDTFSQKYAELCRLNKAMKLELSKNVEFGMAKSLATLHAQNIPTEVLRPETLKNISWQAVDQNKWKFTHELELKISDSKYNDMIPQFQSCHMGRVYLVSMQVSCGKHVWKLNNRFIFNF